MQGRTIARALSAKQRGELRTGGDDAVLEIADDGPGLTPDATTGVGLRSMRERAAELGGHVELVTPGDGGLVVRVLLPLAAARSA